MGECKALLELNGKPLVMYPIEAAKAADIDEILVVTGKYHEQLEKLLPETKLVYNAGWPAGMASSIRAGLQKLSCTAAAVIFMLVDQPFVSGEIISMLAAAYTTGTTGTIFAPVYQGIRSNPVLFDLKVWREQLMQLKGDEGARSIITNHPEAVVTVSITDSATGIDIDTPADYLRASRLARGRVILRELAQMYRGEGTALRYNSPFELLVAVMLSQQCTDERVNKTTQELFSIADSPEKMLLLGVSRLEEYIRGCGLYHSKAKNILATCRILVEEYGGKIPADLNTLVSFPGVGRKTANVILSELYNIPSIPVDTHVARVARRLGLAGGKTPLQVENELKKVIPENKWGHAHHWLIWYGRKICKARQPLCLKCRLARLCPSRQKFTSK